MSGYLDDLADIWGRIRRMNEAARAQYLSTEEVRRSVMLTLVSEVAQDYFQLLGLELQLQIAKEQRIPLARRYNFLRNDTKAASLLNWTLHERKPRKPPCPNLSGKSCCRKIRSVFCSAAIRDLFFIPQSCWRRSFRRTSR
jgi:hypothetical protein